MWFKNLYIVQLTDPFAFTAEELAEKLLDHCAKPCGVLQEFSYGWTPPLGRNSEMLVHSISHFHLIAVRKESKLLPASIVRDALNEKVAELEQLHGRKVGGKEKAKMREETRYELMSRAFHKSQILYGYVDTKNNWLVIDTTNAKKADEFLELLRKSLGKLDVATLETQQPPGSVMTNWLLHKQSLSGFTIETSCQMIDPQDVHTVIKCVNHDLAAEEIIRHLQAHKQVTELALTWNSQLSFTLTDNLLIKRFQFLDMIEAEHEEIVAETAEEKFDADFAIMTAAISELLPAVFSLFGELVKPNKIENPNFLAT